MIIAQLIKSVGFVVSLKLKNEGDLGIAKSPKCTYTRSQKNIAPLHSNTYMQTQPSLPHNNTYATLLNICVKITFQLTQPALVSTSV